MDCAASTASSDLDCEDPLGKDADRPQQPQAGGGPSISLTSGYPASYVEDYESALDEEESQFLSGITQMTMLQGGKIEHHSHVHIY